LSFFISLNDSVEHIKRTQVRNRHIDMASNMPKANKYVKHYNNIFRIQEYFLNGV